MNPISISFVIPYYKIPVSLLKRCLDSLFVLHEIIDMEIILVDDGTPDSPVVDSLSSWGYTDKVIYYAQENQGLGGARNTGMRLASKTYIQFIDPDDRILPLAYLRVVFLLMQHQPDLLSFRLKEFSDVDAPVVSDAEEDKILFDGHGCDFMLQHNLRGSACGYLFRKEIANGLSFIERICHEDEAFTPLLVLRAARLMDTDILAYAYYQRPDSIMNNRDEKQLHRRFTDFLTVQKELMTYLQNLTGNEAVALQRRIDQNNMSIVYKLLIDSGKWSFIKVYLQKMEDQGCYPLPVKKYTAKYLLFAAVTGYKPLVAFWSCVFFCFRKR